MDGTLSTKILFLMTSNERFVGAYLNNRPGRIRYHMSYTGLSTKQIELIGKDRLANQDYLEDLIELTSVLGFIGIDHCLALINESNLYSEKPSDSIGYLNIEMTTEGKWEYSIKIKGLVKEELKSRNNNHPLSSDRFYIEAESDRNTNPKNNDIYYGISRYFNSENKHLIKRSQDEYIFEYKNIKFDKYILNGKDQFLSLIHI